MWNFIPKFVFDQIGGLPFLLVCSYKINKIPVKLSNFHKQVLLAWNLIYKHNFSPQRYYIWNNGDILCKKKSFFLKNWFDKSIFLVSQLINTEGSLMSHDEFTTYYDFPVTAKEFALVMGAIPHGSVTLCRGSFPSDVSLVNLDDAPCGKVCFSTTHKNNNKAIRSLFQNEIVTKPYVITYWSNFVSNIPWLKVWALPHKYLITNKIKEISFKILHKMYPVKHFLKKFKPYLNINCSLCAVHPETVSHLFWKCHFSSKLWKDVVKFINDMVYKDFVLLYEHVLFGFYPNDRKLHEKAYLINLLIILTKFHIHKCKFLDRRPLFTVFYKEF